MFVLRRHWVALCVASSLVWSSASVAAEPLPVTASFSILGDLVRVVGGNRVQVSTLVGANEDAHVFEPKPADVKALAQTRLLVTNGLGFEPWAHQLAQAAGYTGPIVVASDGVEPLHLAEHDDGKHAGHDHAAHAHEEADPHAWQNPQNVVIYVRNIAKALAAADPTGSAAYQANSAAYIKELQALDRWAHTQFDSIAPAKRKAITSHDAFGYLAARYQLTFLAPQGVSTDAQPSAKQVAQLIRQIKREKIRAVFVENMSNPQLLAQLSQDAGTRVGASLYSDALSAPDEPGATYLHMMRHNVTQLALGMRRN